jgi:hypothetical protein
MRLRPLPALAAVLFALPALTGIAGCSAPAGTGGPPPAAPPGTSASGPSSPSPGAVAPPPTSEPPGDGIEYRVSYPFAVPSSPVTISQPFTPPIAAPPAPALPYLVGVYVGNHPEGSPPYQRISFYFRGAFPSYRFSYVPKVVQDGSGIPVSLLGNSFLSIVFNPAQAHDDAGASTIVETPTNPIGFTNLKSYAFAGDYEGYVSYGLGIQVAPGSDQVLKSRAGELKRPDGAGGFFYVVHFDVQTG